MESNVQRPFDLFIELKNMILLIGHRKLKLHEEQNTNSLDECRLNIYPATCKKVKTKLLLIDSLRPILSQQN